MNILSRNGIIIIIIMTGTNYVFKSISHNPVVLLVCERRLISYKY